MPKQVVCFDAKIQFDENAIFRQKWMIEAEQDNLELEKNEREQLAKELVSFQQHKVNQSNNCVISTLCHFPLNSVTI